MRVAAEEYLLINFLMDFLILYIASRGTWLLNAARLSLSSLFASVYALADALYGFTGIWDAAAFLCLMLIAFPVRAVRPFLKTMILALIGLLVFGSSVRLFLLRSNGTLLSGVLGAAAGCVCITAAKAVFRGGGEGRQAQFRVEYAGIKTEFTAIIDTGNLLTEPISALPVLIADERALGKSFFQTALLSEKLREAGFASVGGDGTIKCLRADGLQVSFTGKWMAMQDMWIGLYPGVMRGGVHAFAPGMAEGMLRKKRK